MSTSDDELRQALIRLSPKGAEYESFLANHGPMAAEALLRLDLPGRIEPWLEQYLPRLDDAPASRGVLTTETWRDHLGDARLAGDWQRLFQQELLESDWQSVVRTWWPRLVPGLAASAAHGVIRTCHAVRTLLSGGNREPDPLFVDELARGLGLWASRFHYLSGTDDVRGDLPPVAALAALPRLEPDVPSAGPGIVGRLDALVTQTDLPMALQLVQLADDPESALWSLALAGSRVLAAREDAPIAFCHSVTTPAAVTMALPVLPGEVARATVVTTWRMVGSIVAAFASPRDAAEAERATADGLNVDAMRTQLPHLAVEHGDEHVIKLTEAALRTHAATGDVTPLVAAERMRHRLPALRQRS
jgi:hypothetical protein